MTEPRRLMSAASLSCDAAEQVPAGRCLLLFRNVGICAAVDCLRHAAGLRVALPTDYRADFRPMLAASGEGILFDRLGVALLNVDADQARALTRCADTRMDVLAPEQAVRGARLGSCPLRAVGEEPCRLADTAGATWGLQATGVLTSHYSGRGIRVAILDSGLQLAHPDFLGRAIISRSFVPGLSAADVNGHGTFCAGVACGPERPCEGPRYGIAFGADLYVARVLDDEAGGTDGNVLAGIDWAVRNGCAVISMSLGSPVAVEDSYAQLYEQVAARALAAGSLLLAPAGNESQRPELIAAVQQPANCPSIVAVGAVDQTLGVAPFSNGGHAGSAARVGVVAPGIAIHSAAPGTSRYQTGSGTSMATPFVAGVAALLAEAHPNARGAALRALLQQTCRSLDAPPRDVGAGLVQAPR
jgi:subtilisin